MIVLAFELSVLLALGVVIDQGSQPARSGIGDLLVYGYVTDNMGDPVDGADVTVVVGGTETLTCTTADGGQYQVTFAPSQWDDWDTIVVTVYFNSIGPAVENGVVDPIYFGQIQIDVQFTFEIPEFGSVMGSIVAIAAVAAVAVLFIWKRPR
ncbi:MAG: hypothetical protein A3K60_03480 [Euryarchaeota archaeon RBG_19FT_COMBO_56_21]|nr:MAG: hypothetical protein A3K60_03480 [Euryarchaeota archaeon RBG_19FT_COMBO_56_21]